MDVAPVRPPPPQSPPPPPPPPPPPSQSFRPLLPSLPPLVEVTGLRQDTLKYPATSEEIAGPARLLCRMSIASLVDDKSTRTRLDSPTSDHDTDTSATPTRLPGDSRSTRTPLNSVTQANVRRIQLKRRPSAGPHVFLFDDDDEGDSSASSVDSTPTPSPAKKKRKVNNNINSKSARIARPVARSTPPEIAEGTLVVYQPTCLDHHNDAHQENRARLSVLCGPDGILQKPRFRSLRWANLRELQPVRLAEMLRVHSFQYIQHLERTCGSLPAQSPSTTVGTFYADANETSEDDDKDPLYPNDWMKTKHAKKLYALQHPASSGHFDNDVPISRSSYLAARLAAGAVCHAIDQVMRKTTRNAFVVVRPPGHHAGPNGCVESEGFHRRPEMCTCGFCLLNNVAIGAAYAMATYGQSYYHRESGATSSGINRIAIIDFDIHHGNGTEEILRNLVPHQQKYPLPSSWAPLSFPSYKPWRDEHDVDNVFFASIHLHDADHFYPGSGAGPGGDSVELQHQQNIMNLPLEFIGPKYLEDRERLTAKAKAALMDRASRAFRDNVTTRLLPALRNFQPDLVLVSAGFDGHADDFYYYLTENDYEWMTEQLAAVADECCDGRLVSVLEGGYNVDLTSQQKRKLKSLKKARSRASSSSSSSPSVSPARTEGEDDNDDNGDAMDDEKAAYGSLARSCAAHVSALQRAGGRV